MLSSGVTKDVKNPVITSLCSVVYDLLLVKVRTVLSGMFAEESSEWCKSLSAEPEEVIIDSVVQQWQVCTRKNTG